MLSDDLISIFSIIAIILIFCLLYSCLFYLLHKEQNPIIIIDNYIEENENIEDI
jgi:hypothetical protein